MADLNSIYCPSCRKHTALKDRAKYNLRYDSYRISECNSCTFFFLVKRSIHGGAIQEIYPNVLPKPINKKTPDFLKKDLEEAYLCFSVNAYRATSVMARRALQLCCIDKGAPDKNLRDQIDWLLNQQIITKDLKEWAHEVRLTGNDSAHPLRDITKNIPVSAGDAEDILTLLEEFIKVLYIAPALAKERKAKRNNTKKP